MSEVSESSNTAKSRQDTPNLLWARLERFMAKGHVLVLKVEDQQTAPEIWELTPSALMPVTYPDKVCTKTGLGVPGVFPKPLLDAFWAMAEEAESEGNFIGMT
jgi:hypothetical protein